MSVVDRLTGANQLDHESPPLPTALDHAPTDYLVGMMSKTLALAAARGVTRAATRPLPIRDGSLKGSGLC